MAKRILRSCAVLLVGLGLVWGCGFDDTLREFLDAHFWLPFAKSSRHFEQDDVKRVSAPYAGMDEAGGDSPLKRLRAAYQEISQPQDSSFDVASLRRAIAEARADQSLTRRQREEVDLIDAKIDMRAGQPAEPDLLLSAKDKFEAFLRTARAPEFLSEARGWLARIHYLLGNQTAAGKIYLDELNREGSNLSRETLLDSLRMTYGYDGGPELLAHLEEYFDTPEHAAFAIRLVTNPHWDRRKRRHRRAPARADHRTERYARVRGLLEKNRHLLASNAGASALALLGMRVALSMGDPPAAVKIAEAVPASAEIREQPDFQWMSASARFLSHQYAAAEQPLLRLFRSTRSSDSQRAAAAYALCGVYWKTNNVIEQLRFALWLHSAAEENHIYLSAPSRIEDFTVYWAVSGWDLNLLLDAEAPIEALTSFITRNPDLTDIRLVKYSLAVRLTRRDRYDEAARIYQSINAVRRAPRLRRLAALYRETNRTDLTDQERLEATFRFAEFLSANPDRIYFNDALWHGLQRYALFASRDSRLTREERQALIERERELKDQQEERWRAYLILRNVVREAGKTDLGRNAAKLAVRCLREINTDRFGRSEEIRKADIELSNWLRQ